MNTIRVTNSLDPDQTRYFVGPNPALNCLQKLSPDDTRLELKSYYPIKGMVNKKKSTNNNMHDPR